MNPLRVRHQTRRKNLEEKIPGRRRRLYAVCTSAQGSQEQYGPILRCTPGRASERNPSESALGMARTPTHPTPWHSNRRKQARASVRPDRSKTGQRQVRTQTVGNISAKTTCGSDETGDLASQPGSRPSRPSIRLVRVRTKNEKNTIARLSQGYL